MTEDEYKEECLELFENIGLELWFLRLGNVDGVIPGSNVIRKRFRLIGEQIYKLSND